MLECSHVGCEMKYICVEFKGLPDDVFILIDLYVCELLTINEVSSLYV